MQVTCAGCKTHFNTKPSRVLKSKSGSLFCTRSCKDRAQQIGGIAEIQPSHYRDGSRNYHNKAVAHYGWVCYRCGYSALPIHEVHHKDRNKRNNLLDNLEVLCPNCHATEHYLAKDGKYRTGL